MTKAQFSKLKVGDWVEVLRPLHGYSISDGVISVGGGLGPWTSKITAIGDGCVELATFHGNGCTSRGLAVYLQVVRKVRKPRE